MLISDIESIELFGVNLLDQDDSLNLIDEIIELPLRKSCKIFKEKGIETVMSSANKNNILSLGEKRIEKEDIKGKEYFLPLPTFKDAGKGYAWIMLNFDTLSDENKELVFSLESKLGDNYIWFAHPFRLGNLDYQIKVGIYTYDELKSWLSEDEIPKGIEFDKYASEFEHRHIILSYNDRYPPNTVILRYPINLDTKVSEVETYYASLAERFNNQLIKEDEHFKEYC